jgi:tetratricopeptide (TPR) repeat protein
MTRLKTTIFGFITKRTLLNASFAVLIFLSPASKVWALDELSNEAALSRISSSQMILGFADNLFENKDYYRAITEYKRFIFLFPDNPLVLNVKYKIGLSYLKGDRLEDAKETFAGLSILEEKNEITKKSLFRLAEVYFKDYRYQSSADTYLRFIDEYPDAVETDSARYKLGWSYLFGDEHDKAKKSFNDTPLESPFYAMSQNVSKGMDELADMPRKSPALSGTLSAILPGAGQVYCGRYQDAVTAFILNGLFIWGTVEMFEDDHYAAGGTLAFFSLMWYSGNIFGAVSSAHKFNRDAKSDIIKKLDEKYNLSFRYNGSEKSNLIVLNMRF